MAKARNSMVRSEAMYLSWKVGAVMKKLFAITMLIALCGCADGTTEARQEVASNETASVEAQSDSKLDAEVVLADAIKLAATDNRRVFVHLGAPW